MSIEQTNLNSSPLQFLQSMAQDAAQGMPVWFQEGGLVMWALLIASFLVTVVSLERLSVWLLYPNSRERRALQKCFAALNKRQKTEAMLACQKEQTPALKMLEFAIEALPFSPKEKMTSYAEEQISILSRGQSLLDTVITMAPMLGILGTVLGIIESFNILSLQGVDNPTAVVGGIAQALISTAAGLTVALFALIPYNYFRSKLRKQVLHLESVGSEFNHICEQKGLVTNQPTDIAMEQEKAENAPVEKQKRMPYHYEFSEETGEVTVNIHAQTEHVKRATPSSIAQMYNEELPDIYKHIKTEAAPQNTEKEKVDNEVK